MVIRYLNEKAPFWGFFCTKKKDGNICVNVNYKLPSQHESKKCHSI